MVGFSPQLSTLYIGRDLSRIDVRGHPSHPHSFVQHNIGALGHLFVNSLPQTAWTILKQQTGGNTQHHGGQSGRKSSLLRN